MKRFSELSPEGRADAVENQLQIGLNLAAQGDFGGLAHFLGYLPDAKVIGEIAETKRLAEVGREDVMAAILRGHKRLLTRAAEERAREAYYREPGDIVMGIHDRVLPRQPGSTGRVKIRVLEPHEGGSASSLPQDKVSGVFIDDQLLVAKVACVSRNPELWAGVDLKGDRITPLALFKPMAVQRQKAAVRGWLLTYFNERADRGEFDGLLGR